MTRVGADSQTGECGSADTLIAGETVERTGATVELLMRRARASEYPNLWGATLQTAWDDLPEDERKRLDRRRWEAHFRRKIEPYFEGSRTEKYMAEGTSGEFLGYIVLVESGFLTPETHAFIYDIWVVP